MAKIRVDPQNYFLNENHELPLGEKGGGGVTPKFVGINWTQRANKLSKSLGDVERLNKASKDPLKNRHYYLVADPVSEIIKVSEAKDAKNGQKTEKVEFAGEQSKVFSRLGLELIEVHANGSATVHAAPERMEQLRTRSAGLAGLGARDQARWVSIDDFRWIPANLKFDEEWLSSTDAGPMEVYVKLQPLITEIETDLVIPAITLRLRDFEGLSLKSVGRSYLGRYYLRAVLNRRIVKALASEFTSIQSLHPPILALTNDLPVDIGDGTRVDRVQPRAARGLPCIGVVDTAIPEAGSG